MKKKISWLIFLIMVFFTCSCLKETYDMNLLSGRVHLSPSWGMAVIKGDVTLSDLVKSNDTVVFDQDKFVRLVFKEDSLIDLKMADFYDLNNMVSFHKDYPFGELVIAPFYKTIDLSLDTISQQLSPPLRSLFVALDNTTNNFPSFPSINLGDYPFPTIENFEHAVFGSGAIDISLRNNLNAPLNGARIQLFNSEDNSPIGDEAIIESIQPGDQGMATIDLTDATVTNSIIASIRLTGSPGTTTPVHIDLSENNIELGISGHDLKIKSGRVILPFQSVISLDNKDTIDFHPGNDIELDMFKIIKGNLSYNLQSLSPVNVSIEVTLPTALRSDDTLSQTLTASVGSTIHGSIVADNTTFDLGNDPLQPFNRIPMNYLITVSSQGSMIDFNMDDEITLDIEFSEPEFDYLKGYFGQQTESFEPDSINLEIEDILSTITGDFFLSDPSISLKYWNSFAIPIEVSLEAIGIKNDETVDLGLEPFVISYPAAPANRDISVTFAIDKDNSDLPELISMPPEEIRFSGAAKMNPLGNNGLRDNYLFGDSRFLGSLEIKIPLEFSMNLQFADTIDNFFPDAFEKGDDFNWDDFESVRVDFNVNNGFPLGVSLTMDIIDSSGPTPHLLGSIDATKLLDPAPVGADGKVASGASTSSVTSIEFTPDFFDSIYKADKLVLKFALNTSENKIVKIYSDYRIDFSASLVIKPDINLK